jgi:hypothetical protein
VTVEVDVVIVVGAVRLVSVYLQIQVWKHMGGLTSNHNGSRSRSTGTCGRSCAGTGAA